MADAPAPWSTPQPHRGWTSSWDDPRDDGWSAPTPVRASGAPAAPPAPAHARAPRRAVAPAADHHVEHRLERRLEERMELEGYHAQQRGLPGWAALVVLLVIAGIGGLIDVITGAQVRGGFNYGIVIASVVAILAVRRSAMFPVVIAPPLVYSAGSGFMLYVRSSGLHDRKVLFDAAANWLVYGFPAIASASAAVLIIAGIRMLIRR